MSKHWFFYSLLAVVLYIESKKGSLNPKNWAFSYSEIHTITDNFKTAIGEGGFGKVNLGTLQDETQVAVKLLSPSSKQEDKEFHAEVRHESQARILNAFYYLHHTKFYLCKIGCKLQSDDLQLW